MLQFSSDQVMGKFFQSTKRKTEKKRSANYSTSFMGYVLFFTSEIWNAHFEQSVYLKSNIIIINVF